MTLNQSVGVEYREEDREESGTNKRVKIGISHAHIGFLILVSESDALVGRPITEERRRGSKSQAMQGVVNK